MALLAKTDRLDARVLALFGQRIRPAVRPLPSAEQRDLAELLDRRAQLVAIRAQERARLVTALAIAKPSLQEHIRWLDERIRQLEVDLTACRSIGPEGPRSPRVRGKREQIARRPKLVADIGPKDSLSPQRGERVGVRGARRARAFSAGGRRSPGAHAARRASRGRTAARAAP